MTDEQIMLELEQIAEDLVNSYLLPVNIYTETRDAAALMLGDMFASVKAIKMAAQAVRHATQEYDAKQRAQREAPQGWYDETPNRSCHNTGVNLVLHACH